MTKVLVISTARRRILIINKNMRSCYDSRQEVALVMQNVAASACPDGGFCAYWRIVLHKVDLIQCNVLLQNATETERSGGIKNEKQCKGRRSLVLDLNNLDDFFFRIFWAF